MLFFFLLKPRIFWWIKIVQKNSLSDLFHHPFLIRNRSKSSIPVFRSEISVPFDDPDDVDDDQNVDGDDQNDRNCQDPDAVTSIHPTAKMFWKRIFFINVTLILTSASCTFIVNKWKKVTIAILNNNWCLFLSFLVTTTLAWHCLQCALT